MRPPISEQLRVLIYRKTGLRQPRHSSDRAESVVRSRLEALRLESTAEYEKLLEGENALSQAEVRELIVGLTNGETQFFRDKGQFALLENTLLPSLIETNKLSKKLRIWSAACATGEEVHSISIILDSLLPPHAGWDVEVLGTDINEEALRTAQTGLYSKWSFRGVSQDRKAAYFEPNSDDWQVKARVRRKVRFHRLDLIHDDFDSVESRIRDIDLVLCKNVFIYFEPNTIRPVLGKITNALRPGGYLLTAHGELHAQELGQLRVLTFPESSVYQRHDLPRPGHAVAESNVAVFHRSEPSPTEQEDANTRTELEEFEHHARNCANEGKYEQAEEWCQRALQQDPFAPGIYYLLAKIAEERKQTERAKEMLNRVLYLDPQFVPAYIDLATLYDASDSKRVRKLRTAALDCLRRLKPDDRIEIYDTTAAELIAAIETQMACEARV